jgi:proline iminopeptidase
VDINRNRAARGLQNNPLDRLLQTMTSAPETGMPAPAGPPTEAPQLFPPITPYRSGYLAVDPLHTLYWEECGNPEGEAVVFLHGGPGGGISPRHRQFFDPSHYRIVLFDQRGAGQSMPHGEVRDNSTGLLVDDIERLREMLGISSWLVFGGSWGSTLALAYGQRYPQRCAGFILRGIFLCTQPEIDWFMYGMGQFFPEAYAAFTAEVPREEGEGLLQAYARQLFGADQAVALRAARSWSAYEGRCAFLHPNDEAVAELAADSHSLSIGRLEAHYFLHAGFLGDGELLANIGRISHLPALIVQGRYDMICPPAAAYQLHQAWPASRLVMVPDAGHSASEPGNTAALVAATEEWRKRRAF